VLPTPQPPTAEPTEIASYYEPVQPVADEDVGRGGDRLLPSLVGWLGVAQVVFGVAFVLLAMLTIALTVRRFRTR
jgi:hypothetical protein